MTEHDVCYEEFVIPTKVDEHFTPVVLLHMPELAHDVFKSIIWVSDNGVEVPNHEQNIFLGSCVNDVLELAVEFFGFLAILGRVWDVNLDYGHVGYGSFQMNGDKTFRDRMDSKKRLFGSLWE